MNPSSETSAPLSASRRRPSSAARATSSSTTEEIPAPGAGPEGKRSWLPLALVAALLAAGAGWFAYTAGWLEQDQGLATAPTSVPIPARYDADRAFGYLVDLCDIGPRPSGSQGMQRQQQYLTEFFTRQGGDVRLQSFEINHPETGVPLTLANLIASWYPEREKRYLLCAHYDTRPFPDRDRENPRGVFVGANDGASGTAALMELSHSLAQLPPDVGVDLVLFDGEEFIFQDRRDEYFLGSIHFAEQYVAQPPARPYQAGILLDMVGDRELKLYFEQNSIRYARDVARSVWKTAAELGVTAFIPRTRHELRDDHLPLNQIAQIPTIDIIDFDYPRPGLGEPSHWHTQQDVPANCSGESLAAVVWVVHTWLVNQSTVAP